jgi:hypothetical protein
MVPLTRTGKASGDGGIRRKFVSGMATAIFPTNSPNGDWLNSNKGTKCEIGILSKAVPALEFCSFCSSQNCVLFVRQFWGFDSDHILQLFV